jgi:hypothetical protein
LLLTIFLTLYFLTFKTTCMKKMILFPVWTLLFSCAFISCQKEGPIGPSGADGAQGEKGDKGDKGDKGNTGAQGDPGNMSILVQDITIKDWTASKYVDGSFAGQAGKLDKITKNVIAAGVVLVYQVQKDILKALPYSQIMERGNPFTETGAADYTLTATYDVAPGELSVYLQYSTAKVKSVAGKTFRLVIIPGAAGKRISTRSGNNYSIEQLRGMSYEEVCAALDIR